MDEEALTGYIVIETNDAEEAEKIAKSCPIITSIKMYEVR